MPNRTISSIQIYAQTFGPKFLVLLPFTSDTPLWDEIQICCRVSEKRKFQQKHICTILDEKQKCLHYTED